MTRHHNPQRLLEGLEPPNPPPELRGRCLAAARAAQASREHPDVWTRLWASSTARWTWAATVAGLLLAHAALTIDPATPATPSNRIPFLVAGVLPDSDLADLVDLRPLRAGRLPLLGADEEGVVPQAELHPERS